MMRYACDEVMRGPLVGTNEVPDRQSLTVRNTEISSSQNSVCCKQVEESSSKLGNYCYGDMNLVRMVVMVKCTYPSTSTNGRGRGLPLPCGYG